MSSATAGYKSKTFWYRTGRKFWLLGSIQVFWRVRSHSPHVGSQLTAASRGLLPPQYALDMNAAGLVVHRSSSDRSTYRFSGCSSQSTHALRSARICRRSAALPAASGCQMEDAIGCTPFATGRLKKEVEGREPVVAQGGAAGPEEACAVARACVERQVVRRERDHRRAGAK